MRKYTGWALVCLAAGLGGCTLSAGLDADADIVTATPGQMQPATLAAVIQIPPPVRMIEPTPISTATVENTITDADIDATVAALLAATDAANTATAAARPTDTATATATMTETLPATITLPPPPTAIPPTRTHPGPPTLIPFDDGSGALVPGTGGTTATSYSPIPGLEALPHTLYYLSDAGNVNQVFRLQIGLPYPEQLTYSATGVRAFDVAPDGTLAYVTGQGDMVIGGLPFLPPANPDGSMPQVDALAWSPDGNWLAYTLVAYSNDTDAAADSLWLRDRAGTTSALITESPEDHDGWAVYGDIYWKPDNSELLVEIRTGAGLAALRTIINSRDVIPVWDAEKLPFDSYLTAYWNAAGNAIITSGPDSILKIDPATLNPTPLFTSPGDFPVRGARESLTGALAFIAGTNRVYLLAPNTVEPQVIASFSDGPYNPPDYLWSDDGSVNFIMVYPNSDLGTGYFRDQFGNLLDLTPLTGLVGLPQWGPTFKKNDQARVHITRDPLNVRATPGGEWIASLTDGVQVTIIGGPVEQDGYMWWQIRVATGVTGWSVEAVMEADGSRLQTLRPVPK